MPPLTLREPHAPCPLCNPLLAGDTCEGVAALLREQLDRLAQEGPTQREMARVKKASRVDLLSAVTSNSSMARALASYHATWGSWQGLLEELQVVEGLRAEEVQAVAQRVFDPANCFAGYAYPLQA